MNFSFSCSTRYLTCSLLTHEISSWPLEDKIHIHARACNILYIREIMYFKRYGYGCFDDECIELRKKKNQIVDMPISSSFLSYKYYSCIEKKSHIMKGLRSDSRSGTERDATGRDQETIKWGNRQIKTSLGLAQLKLRFFCFVLLRFFFFSSRRKRLPQRRTANQSTKFGKANQMKHRYDFKPFQFDL